jgi:hypothetical protein
VALSGDSRARARQLANLRLQRSGPPPAPPAGNARAVVHGAYAALPVDRVDAKARSIAAAVAQDAPVRADDGGLPAADGVVVRLLADALCRLDSIGEYLGRCGWQDSKGRPRAVLDVEARLRNQALDLTRELGMTPRSRAALGLDLVRAVAAGDQLAQHLHDHYGADVEATAEENGDQGFQPEVER